MIIDCQNIKCKKSFNTDDSSKSNRKTVWYVCPFCKRKHKLVNEISSSYIRQADGSLKIKHKIKSYSEGKRIDLQLSKEERRKLNRTGKYAKTNN